MIPADKISRVKAPKTEKNMETSIAQKKVLIVDDHSLLRDMLKTFLEGEYEVLHAASAEEGLRIFREQNPDVVLMDIVMPGESGLDALKTMRSLDDKVSVVMMTGFPKLETAEEAIALGASNYLEKPFEPDDVYQVVREGVDRTRELRRRQALEEEMKGIIWDLSRQYQTMKKQIDESAPAVQLMHDLKRPLEKTLQSVQNLAKKSESTEELKAMAAELDLIAHEIRHCSEMVGLCRELRAGSMEYLRKMSAPFMLHQIIEDISLWASRAGIRLDARMMVNRGSLMCHPARLPAALKAVICNGVISVAPGKGEVRLACADGGTSLDIRIEFFDGGADPAELLKSLGKPCSASDVEQGLGFGLSIPARVIRDHGGEMHVQSAAGKATVVFIKLPMA